MDKLHFLTAGIPSNAKDYSNAFEILEQDNLDGLEVEFVHGVRYSPKTREYILSRGNKLITHHGPYYINLNSKEEDKKQASIKRVLDTARAGQDLGAYSITYHAAFYLGEDSKAVTKKMIDCHKIIVDTLCEENNNIWIRPETTGKNSQWGTLGEIIELSKEFKQVLPCIDFAHMHARNNGIYNTYDEFCKILETLGNNLGDIALNNFHGHVAGIEYGLKGEKKHLIFEEADFNYKDLLRAMKKFNIKGALVCESPNIEIDAKILKDYYTSL
ncbi:MAG: TIM barrel protein [Candidatus Gastranaerophilales bacterium]|nr:TIM barrel protein [Candidatus Gastranaerophilales bacterium]